MWVAMSGHNYKITLALIAHDRYKQAMGDFMLDHRDAWSRFNLVATQGTGLLVQKRTGQPVHLLEHGPAGGAEQIGELASASMVQAVIFFRDPISPGPHEPDFIDLLRVCDLRQIPMATNRASAEALLYFLQTSPDRSIITARCWGIEQTMLSGN